MIPEPPAIAASGSGRLRDLLLGIFLVQLAFFIVLVSLARPDFGRTKDVLANVADVFGTSTDQNGKPHRIASPTGGLDGEPVIVRVGTLAGELFGVRAVAITGPGDEMHLTVPLAKLFDDASADVRPAGDHLFDALVTGFGALPADLTMMIEASLEMNDAEETLALRRANALARRLIARGTPAEALAIGDGGPADAVRFVVRLVAEPTARATAPRGPVPVLPIALRPAGDTPASQKAD